MSLLKYFSRLRFAVLLLGPQKYSLILVMVVFLSFQQLIIVSSSIYENYISADLGSKQAHVTFSLNDSTQDLEGLLGALQVDANVMVASRYSSLILDSQLKVNSQLSFDDVCRSNGTRWFNGKYRVVAIDKSIPNVIPLEDIAFYTAGIYRTRVTDLEFAYYWLTDDRIVLPNHALRSSFYPPISQGASLVSNNICASLLGSINDYKDAPMLYMGFELFDRWASSQDFTERGVMVRLYDARSAPHWARSWSEANASSIKGWTVTTWLDTYERQRAIFEMVKIMAIGAAVLTLVTSLLIIALVFARLKVDRRDAFKLAYISGFDFRIPVLHVIILGCVFLHGLFAIVTPIISTFIARKMFELDSFDSSISLYPLLTSASLFSSVAIFNFVGKAKL